MGLGKAFMTVGKMSEKVLTGIGDTTIGAGKVAGKAGKAAGKLGNKTGIKMTKEIAEDAMEDQTLYGRLIGKTLTPWGVGAVTIGTMGFSTGNAILDNGGSKFANLGNVSFSEEGLDRLIGYDGEKFAKGVNKISGGDTGVKQDVVKNSFNSINQLGASGDIVFALHNMREG